MLTSDEQNDKRCEHELQIRMTENRLVGFIRPAASRHMTGVHRCITFEWHIYWPKLLVSDVKLVYNVG